MQQQQQEDIWTHIPTKFHRHRHRQKEESSSLLPTTINPPLKDLTLTHLSTEFHSKLKLWQASPCRKTLLSLLSRIRPEAGWELHKAICLGSGSLSRENWECRRRSLWQFVVFFDLARYLLDDDDMEGGKMRSMYAQEPAFTELDREFLTVLGVRVLESKVGGKGVGGGGMGAAAGELGTGTFLFEPFVDMDVGMLEDILKNGVGLYMGSSIDGILERRGGSEVGKLASTFSKGREMRKFPVFEMEPNVLEGMGIYWMEEGDEEEDDAGE